MNNGKPEVSMKKMRALVAEAPVLIGEQRESPPRELAGEDE
jgi:hypothetical protein